MQADMTLCDSSLHQLLYVISCIVYVPFQIMGVFKGKKKQEEAHYSIPGVYLFL